MKVSAQQLAENFKKDKSERTFNQLYFKLKPSLSMFLRKYFKSQDDIDEVISLSFSKVWSKIDQYNEYYQFNTWLYTIAKNEALGKIRDRNKKSEVSFDVMVENGTNIDKFSGYYEIDNINEKDIIDEMYSVAIEEMKNLPDKYMDVLIRREIQGKKYKEIADELNLNIKTTKTRIRKGRQLLKNVVINTFKEK